VDFEASRAEIVSRVAAFVTQTPGPHSFRSLSVAAGLNAGTVRHYFGDGEGLIRAVLAHLHAGAEPMLRQAATDVPPDVEASFREFLIGVVFGWHDGLGAIHRLGMTYGLSAAGFGPTYLSSVLEPTLTTAEARLARHVAEGRLPPLDLRAASLTLVTPVVMALLHQETFGGGALRPLDVGGFVEQHARWCVRAFSAAPPRPTPGGTARG
jgi:AcrR family transcriptional regulator